jgi:hypothetical protein
MSVEPSDVTLLVMAWAMGAARMGYISRQEWMAAVPRLGGAATAPALQEELRTLHQALLRDIERFRDLHVFTHRFCREERRKTIDVRRAINSHAKSILLRAAGVQRLARAAKAGFLPHHTSTLLPLATTRTAPEDNETGLDSVLFF